MTKKLLSAVLLSTALLIGCGDDDEENNIDTEGCEHLKEGPSTSVTASATASNAPAIRDDHRRYDITLTDMSGGKGGSVSFAAAETSDYVLFISADVPVSVTNASGQTVQIEESVKSSSECSEIKGRHIIPMTVGTHTLTFGPTSQTSVSIVIEETDHGHEH